VISVAPHHALRVPIIFNARIASTTHFLSGAKCLVLLPYGVNIIMAFILHLRRNVTSPWLVVAFLCGHCFLLSGVFVLVQNEEGIYIK